MRPYRHLQGILPPSLSDKYALWRNIFNLVTEDEAAAAEVCDTALDSLISTLQRRAEEAVPLLKTSPAFVGRKTWACTTWGKYFTKSRGLAPKNHARHAASLARKATLTNSSTKFPAISPGRSDARGIFAVPSPYLCFIMYYTYCRLQNYFSLTDTPHAGLESDYESLVGQTFGANIGVRCVPRFHDQFNVMHHVFSPTVTRLSRGKSDPSKIRMEGRAQSYAWWRGQCPCLSTSVRGKVGGRDVALSSLLHRRYSYL